MSTRKRLLDVFEDGRKRPRITLSNSIPIELKYDVVQFLDRDEIEKMQLVNKSWKKAIETILHRIPLRKAHSLTIREFYRPRGNFKYFARIRFENYNRDLDEVTFRPQSPEVSTLRHFYFKVIFNAKKSYF